MEQELLAFNNDRSEQLTVLLEKQRRDLSKIDSEITNLGVNVAELVDSMQEMNFFSGNSISTNNPDNHRASVISLPRSFSTGSFSTPTTASSTNGTQQHS